VQTERKRKVVTMMRQPITFHREAGQTMAEYAVVLGVITLAIVTTFSLLSGAVAAAFDRTLAIITSIV
jgi:Flp pilus assembly pilin Flp